MKAVVTPIPRLVEDYLADARARGLSPSTLSQSYGYPLRSVLIPWCSKHGIESVEGLDRRALNSLSAHLLELGGKRDPLSRHSVHTYMRTVNRLLTWADTEAQRGRANAQ